MSGIAPAKRIKRSEASLYQFETLRRSWVDERLRLGLREEFQTRRDSEAAFAEKLERHSRHGPRARGAHSRAASFSSIEAPSRSLGRGADRGGGFEEWKVSIE